MKHWWLLVVIAYWRLEVWEAEIWIDGLARAIEGGEKVLLANERLVRIWRRAYEKLADAEDGLAGARQCLLLHQVRRRAGLS